MHGTHHKLSPGIAGCGRARHLRHFLSLLLFFDAFEHILHLLQQRLELRFLKFLNLRHTAGGHLHPYLLGEWHDRCRFRSRCHGSQRQHNNCISHVLLHNIYRAACYYTSPKRSSHKFPQITTQATPADIS